VPVYRLDSRIVFPPADRADDNGLLAIGGDLSPERLLLAYESGIFPWYEEGLPILWHSPDPRYVLLASKLHVPRSLDKQIKRGTYRIEVDRNFRGVMARCGNVARPGQTNTWITEDMLSAYSRLHELGFAHSAEAYVGDDIVGGLYGVSLGSVFFGESMFATAPDASKVAFVSLLRQMQRWGIDLVDCQVHTGHLARFGAEAWPRKKYLVEVARRMNAPTRRGRWSLLE